MAIRGWLGRRSTIGLLDCQSRSYVCFCTAGSYVREWGMRCSRFEKLATSLTEVGGVVNIFEYRKARLICEVLQRIDGRIDIQKFDEFMEKIDELEVSIYWTLKTNVSPTHWRQLPEIWFRGQSFRNAEKKLRNLPVFKAS